MNRRMGKRKLTRLVLAALMSAGGGLWTSSAEAAEQWITENTTISNDQSANSYRLSASGITFTVENGGKVGTVWSPESGNKFNLMAGGEFRSYTNYGGEKNNIWNIYGAVTNTSAAAKIAGGQGNGDGEFSGNKVNVFQGAQISTAVYGGYSDNNATVTNNTVMIAGGTFTDKTKSIYGGYSNGGKADGNTVNISDGTIAGNVYGGSSNTSTATDNTVTISSGTVGTAGLDRSIYGGVAGGSASNNEVTITGGTINADIYGGSGNTANNNTVTISGNTVFGKNGIDEYYGVHGGMGSGDVMNNTVNILTAITVGNLIGGESYNGGTSSGNTLNIAAVGVRTGNLNPLGMPTSFQNINFYLPSGVANGDTMLTVTGGTLNSKTNLTGVAIGAAVQSGASLAKGDAVNLITNPNGLVTDSTTTMKQITDETVTIQTKPEPKTLTTDQSYTLEVSQKDDTTIIATITDVEEKKRDDPDNPDNPGGSTLEEKTKSLVETRAATTTFVNAGADMLASQGFMQAANAVALDAAEAVKNGTGAQNVGGFTPFAAFGGSGMRAESGSHVDTKGFGLNIGFARELPNSQGKLLFGPVVEYGGGSYDSHLDDGTRGEGGAHYFGVGLMARQVNHNGFYYEGSVRGGRVTSDYESNDVVTGAKVGYDSASNYWAAHLGVGKAMNVGGNNTVDAYLKYFYSHQSGDDVAIKFNGNETGDRGNFDSVDSNRIRIGARLTHKINDMNSIYGGLAYQYEFGGEARAHFTGVGETPSPSVKGSSGMLELGWQVKPGGPVTLDLGVTGWAGKQRGGSVQLGATWTF